MKRIIKLTILTDLICCFAMMIMAMMAMKESIEIGFYVGLMTFGNILLPTLGTVIIHSLLKHRIKWVSVIPTIIFQSIILFILLWIGIFIWAAIDVYLFKTLTIMNIKNNYEVEFSGYVIVVYIEALLIPIFNYFINREAK